MLTEMTLWRERQGSNSDKPYKRILPTRRLLRGF